MIKIPVDYSTLGSELYNHLGNSLTAVDDISLGSRYLGQAGIAVERPHRPTFNTLGLTRRSFFWKMTVLGWICVLTCGNDRLGSELSPWGSISRRCHYTAQHTSEGISSFIELHISVANEAH